MSETEPALVIGSIDYGDHDRIVRLLTPHLGRTAVMVRGARSGRKPWASTLQTGSLIRPELKRTRGHLPLMVEAHLHAHPKRAREDLDRLAALAYGVELCAALSPEHHEAAKLFRLILVWLSLLEGSERPGPASRQALEAKALTFAGLTPALATCPVCGEGLADPVVFSCQAGGGAHAACAPGSPVEASQVLRLEAFRRTPLAETVGVRAATPLYLLTDFAEWHLGAGLKSRPMLEEIEATREGATGG